MRFRMFAGVPACLLVCALLTQAQGPRISSVNPLNAKVGQVVTANGDGVGPESVDELYLTNSTQDIKVEITEQTDKAIKFKVPTDVKPGRWALMTHLKSGTGTRLIEHPVKLTVEQ
jgi:hypothetical protein